jgi:squalene-hopene/tetraprenyl-beta-curcumene cyclase
MSLAAMGLRGHLVVQRGVDFLKSSIRADGSWPIDTNLSTWATTLSIKALAHQEAWAPPETRMALREWLLAQQYRVEHPFTHAAPGGWAWTDMPGGVPDADDTAGALIALPNLGVIDAETRVAGINAIQWLLRLQNRDGGIPTFCRGWGALPFDRSSPDLTAHALRAWSGWLPQIPEELVAQTEHAIYRALRFLSRMQNADGSWLPLWFGNEHAPEDANFTYGTTHVLVALRELEERGFHIPNDMAHKAAAWLMSAQDASGGWSGFPGGPPSVEETALAVEALAGYRADAAHAGARWLMRKIEDGSWRVPSPIGFYFAKLWYYERLYPQIFTVAALGKLAALRPESTVEETPHGAA